MFSRDKITSNYYRYFAAAVVVFIGIFILIEHEAVTEIVESQADMIMGREAPDRCGPTSFWAKYDIWGDTDSIYAPPASEGKDDIKQEAEISCEPQTEKDQ